MNFNPRAPCGARLSRTYSLTRAPVISTHAPLAGRDALVLDGALVEHRISTHAPLAGRDNLIKGVNVTIGISTHAPLAGRDGRGVFGFNGNEISTHAPLAGRDSL